MKKKIIICGVIILIVIIICLCISLIGKDKQTPIGKEKNNREAIEVIYEEGITKINTTKKLQNLEISNFEITKSGSNSSELKAKVLNISDEIVDAQTVEIIVSDDEGMREIIGGSIPTVMPNKSTELISIVRKDITSATNIELKIVKQESEEIEE